MSEFSKKKLIGKIIEWRLDEVNLESAPPLFKSIWTPLKPFKTRPNFLIFPRFLFANVKKQSPNFAFIAYCYNMMHGFINVCFLLNFINLELIFVINQQFWRQFMPERVRLAATIWKCPNFLPEMSGILDTRISSFKTLPKGPVICTFL